MTPSTARAAASVVAVLLLPAASVVAVLLLPAWDTPRSALHAAAPAPPRPNAGAVGSVNTSSRAASATRPAIVRGWSGTMASLRSDEVELPPAAGSMLGSSAASTVKGAAPGTVPSAGALLPANGPEPNAPELLTVLSASTLLDGSAEVRSPSASREDRTWPEGLAAGARHTDRSDMEPPVHTVDAAVPKLVWLPVWEPADAKLLALDVPAVLCALDVPALLRAGPSTRGLRALGGLPGASERWNAAQCAPSGWDGLPGVSEW